MGKIRIRQAEGIWTVRAGGAVLGETSAALELSEDGRDPVIYFPREDLAMIFLDATDHQSHCPHKGDASYFSIVTKSKTIPNTAWSYETPKDDVADIKDHIAFYATDEVAIENV